MAECGQDIGENGYPTVDAEVFVGVNAKTATDSPQTTMI